MTLPTTVTFANDPVVLELAALTGRAAAELAGPKATFAELEEVGLAVSNEAVRVMLQTRLQAVADAHGKFVEVDGVRHVRHEVGEVSYHSLCGTLKVRRATYRQTGEHNGPTVVPLDLDAGLVERGTPALSHSIALGYAKHDLRSHAEDLAASHRVVPSRATMERMAGRIGEEAIAASPRIESYVRQAEHVPEGTVAASIGLDRTTVPMAEDRAEDASPAAPRKVRRAPYVRAVPAPIDVHWRMAYVGTITLTNDVGEAVVTRKYAATASEGSERIMKQLLADLRSALRQSPRMAVGVVQDGAPELWTVVTDALMGEASVSTWCEAIDRFHLNERLGAALQIVEPTSTETPSRYERWQASLDVRDDAIDEIESWLVQAYGELDPDAAEKLWPHLVYLRNNKGRMRYASLRARGLPVGSGATEGTCKSVVGIRTKRSGQRWREEGLANVLTLRAIHQSDRFPSFWKHLCRRYVARVESVAA